MTQRTALTIWCNPQDLSIQLIEYPGNLKFGFSIGLGPGGSFRTLLTSRPFANTLEKVVECVCNLLLEICKNANNACEQISNILSDTSFPIEPLASQGVTLEDLLPAIEKSLLANGSAKTYQEDFGK